MNLRRLCFITFYAIMLLCNAGAFLYIHNQDRNIASPYPCITTCRTDEQMYYCTKYKPVENATYGECELTEEVSGKLIMTINGWSVKWGNLGLVMVCATALAFYINKEEEQL